MTVRWLALALAVVFSGCGGGSDGDGADGRDAGVDSGGGDDQAPCENISGARLRARSFATTDGTEQFVTWYDQDRDEECSYRTASDGKTRCLPASTPVGDVQLYTDAGCTQAVIPLTPGSCGGAPKYLTFPAAPCEVAPLVPLGVVVSFGATAYARQGASCVAQAPPATGTYYSFGAPLDPGLFVEGRAGTAMGTSRLGRKFLEGSDGSRDSCRSINFDSAYDSDLGEDCGFGVSPDGTARCLPTRRVSPGPNFRDDNCVTPSIDVPAMSCGQPVTTPSYVTRPGDQVTLNLGSGCFWFLSQRISSLGPELSTYYSTTGGTCGPVAPPSPDPERHFGIGVEVDPSTFAGLAPAVRAGTERIQLRDYVTTDGGFPFRGGLYDAELDLVCTFRTASDGKLRCLPTSLVQRHDGFADPACTAPIAFASRARTYGCSDELPRFIQEIDFAACPTIHRVFPLGAPIDAKVYTQLGATCVEFELPEADLHTFEAELPASMFMEATVTTE